MPRLRHTLFSLSTVATLYLSAQARLGETQVEIEKRNGKPITTQESTAVVMDMFSDLHMFYDELDMRASAQLSRMTYFAYRKENWIVAIVYLDGKSVLEKYSKRDSFTIEEAELIQLLKFNAANKEWRREVREGDDRHNLKWNLIGGQDTPGPYATAILGGRGLTVAMPSLAAYVKEVRDNVSKQDADRKRKALMELTGANEPIADGKPKSPPTPVATAPEPDVRGAAIPKQPAAPANYMVVGVAPGDFLNVRSGPAMNSSVVFKLTNGDKVQVTGQSAYNGDTEWVPITADSQQGWVRHKYLRSQPK